MQSFTLPKRSPITGGRQSCRRAPLNEAAWKRDMDFTLSNEQRAWQMTARKFAEEEIRPISLERDEISDPREAFDWEIIRKGSKLGFRTLAVPKEWGGPGTDFVTQALVMSELARADSAICKTFSQCWKWSHLIAATCTDEQKDRFLKPFLEDDTYLLGKGITEPSAGSDNRLPPDDPRAGLKLRAERRGDEWILNGEKCFIANASVGKLFFIDARTNPNVPLKQGITMFLVPRDTPGLRIGKVFNKSGWRFYQNGEMIFENARVPHANVVGDVNGAVRKSGNRGGDTTGGDIFGDLELSANALGVCDDACDLALKVARTARQGGKPLFEQQVVQLKLNRMHLLTEALRAFVMRIAWEHDHKVRSANAGLCMNFSTDVIQEVTELNLDIHASAGVIDSRAEKLVRDSIIWSHLAGDSVQRMKVTRRLAG
jgi:alkylation response protein AidB-like acyl-CoA dehydrogenase